MKTCYFIPSGQKIRSLQNIGINEIPIKVKESNYPELCKCDGQDNFTNKSWSTDINDVKKMARDWAYYPKLIKFVINK